MNDETLGRRIARMRLEHGMTQERLASIMSVTPQAVSKWENDLSYPDITLLPLLSQTFGITVDELLGVGAHTSAAAPAHEEEPVPQPQSETKTAPDPVPQPQSETKTAPDPVPQQAAEDQVPKRATHLCIHITDNGRDAVNLSIPLRAASSLGSMSGLIAGHAAGLNIQELVGYVQDTEPGTIIDLDDGDDHVTISLA